MVLGDSVKLSSTNKYKQVQTSTNKYKQVQKIHSYH